MALLQALNFVSVVATALMLWKGISLLTNTESPIVVVLSGSMEPAFQRGDLLFLALPPKQPLRTGDITVYNVGSEIPIVHRVIEVHDEWVAAAAAAVAAFVDRLTAHVYMYAHTHTASQSQSTPARLHS